MYTWCGWSLVQSNGSMTNEPVKVTIVEQANNNGLSAWRSLSIFELQERLNAAVGNWREGDGMVVQRQSDGWVDLGMELELGRVGFPINQQPPNYFRHYYEHA